MATVIRKTDPHLQTLVDAHNALKSQIGAGAFFHLDKSEITSLLADATDLASTIALANQLKKVWNGGYSTTYPGHTQDTLAHKVVDSTDVTAVADASDLTTVEALLNDLKAKFNTHIASTTYHYNADATNTIATANATDLATSEALANSIKAALLAHWASGPSAASLRSVAG